jgi:hypothetical protein
MDSVWIPLLSALLGGIIGSAATVITVIVQSRAERRRDRLRLAVQAAIEDYHNQHELFMKRREQNVKTTLAPMSSYIHYHTKVLELLDKNRLTPEVMRDLQLEMLEFDNIATEFTRHVKATTQGNSWAFVPQGLR